MRYYTEYMADTHRILALYPLLYYTYYHKYAEWVKSEEWTFIYCVLLGAGHALSFLATAWSSGVNARISYTTVSCKSLIRSVP
jgi:cation-transporting ATPase 13A1